MARMGIFQMLFSVNFLLFAMAESTYYTAAIFEHARRGQWPADTPQQIVQKNIEYFAKAAVVAKAKGADIIVFPEYGLFPLLDRETMKAVLETIPDPRNRSWNPCEQEMDFLDRPMLRTLSCMAKQNNIVVVANTGDIQPCTKEEHKNCPDDGVYHFNANAAFDRDGTLLARYHKEHLFFETGMDLPVQKQDPVFKTDFGTFAMFVCFDIIFKSITDTAQERRVDSVLLPTEWMDSMPHLNSILYFQSWAYGNNVTLLATNGQIPSHGTVGSGVFTANMGALKYTFNPDSQSKLVVSRVPRSRRQSAPFPNLDASITVISENGTVPFTDDGKDVPELCSSSTRGVGDKYSCKTQPTSNYTLVELTKLSDILEGCNKGLCCSLRYSAKRLDDSYYLLVFNGTKDALNHYFWSEELCMVARCSDSSGKTCSSFPLRTEAVFQELELKANFTTRFVYPSVVNSAMRLAAANEWDHGLRKAGKNYLGYLQYRNNGTESLLVAGLYGRCYDRDPPYVKADSKNTGKALSDLL